LKDIVAKGYSPLDLRYFYFMAQYGSFQNFTRESMQQAQNARQNLIKKVGNDMSVAQLFVKETSFIDIEGKLTNDDAKKIWSELIGAIGDDMNTPKLIATINSCLSHMNDEIRSLLYRLEIHFLKI